MRSCSSDVGMVAPIDTPLVSVSMCLWLPQQEGPACGSPELVPWQEVRSRINGGAERVVGTGPAAEIAVLARFSIPEALRMAPPGACG